MSFRIAIILGTRPEIIKLAPVIHELQHRGHAPFIIATGQHRELAQMCFGTFGIEPNIDLELMEEKQSPNVLLGRLLPLLEEILQKEKPAGVIVQGDTTSALGGALAAFHLQIPVAHVEAGLRSGDLSSPFPEEMNRVMLSKLASVHFSPTAAAARNLRQEGIEGEIVVTGNTVVDALHFIQQQLALGKQTLDSAIARVDPNLKTILVTCHRRENWDKPLESLCSALATLINADETLQIVFPVHPNPHIRETVLKRFSTMKRVILLPPLDYPSTIGMLQKSSLVISDSGGIQEEATSLGIPVIVTRTATDRPEAIEAGLAHLIAPADTNAIVEKAIEILRNPKPIPRPVFGDGKAGIKITGILLKNWGLMMRQATFARAFG